MDAPPLLLASASPRRRRLIGWLGVSAGCIATDTHEDTTAVLPPVDLAASLASEKARAAREAHGKNGAIILAFDTIVVADGRVLGKPVDEHDARRMLAELSGKLHEVVTGVAILGPHAEDPACFAVTTPVLMRTLDEATVASWIARGEYLGCAGAYNIEHHLASVAADECFQNVAGLPLCHVYRALADGVSGTGLPDLVAPVASCDAALHRTCKLGPEVCSRSEAGGRAPQTIS